MKRSYLVLVGVVFAGLLTGCVVHKENVTPAPQAWLSSIVRSPQAKISGTYQLFPTDVTDAVGRDDRFNLYDLLFHASAQMAGIRAYSTVGLIETDDTLSVTLGANQKPQATASLRYAADYQKSDLGFVIERKNSGASESGSHTWATIITLSPCTDRTLLVHYQEKFKTNDIFYYERRTTDLWLRFSPVTK